MKKIVVIGAGPTGLSAAFRLRELGHENFVVYERNNYVGGLCKSFIDNHGFTWDLGGHVIFSHYEYFDRFLETALGTEYLLHRRNTWIRTMGQWIPYPFQNNLQYLPRNVIAKCLKGLRKADRGRKKTKNFEEWINATMGEGIAQYFMLPYNFKVWAYPLDQLSSSWIDERVSPVNLKETVSLLKSPAPKTDWGPNAAFKFPKNGGTGQIFNRIAKFFAAKIKLSSQLTKIDVESKKIYLADGQCDTYDILINTSPLDQFVALLKPHSQELIDIATGLKHNGVFIVGVGIKKPCPSDKSWNYFPDSNCPFFRVTYFSNYSPQNVPNVKEYYSLLCESAYSEYKKEDESEIVEKTIQGLINSGLISASDKRFIVSRFLFDIEYAYPVPTLEREDSLKRIQPALQAMDIYSRGRFGAWKYEIGNTDHSVMQGKEIVDKILSQSNETVWEL
ncbi:MAG: hypothetical protein A3G33_03245 [Omnitrophica bacterium RIFCSPLOWO2_12_FULL_44_17]|uniref:Amine oxidase domain-containing protein n=1 Tax=Candidatus Danuiimicrobium aquiferis TaxID=1801832 RepID=A0A1G1KU05_9BACT|nr:MAG: hypothetical protein A3B72_06790 [Omnitrophica bacterium RIFCSPHIGHO2_02_FULL_45_28]OGW88537.1 MAG: hypothetical protein A3E74_02045 [Omnitrophica bacterium RIFCSPHIGHO2_12_FULL_44_12]OGW96335.1 MAG: hypothetical protein A3G33_03245 [Omnitrophica bacterium RIFCSPLOWO2_12_FULL_44_17]OGX04856.1 MAG: hypothetical protein A3J12_07885 [Omnitrophica bacterium RIFCSPLOWO2_02_FULL_44_11]